eukprot:TRINITY_DN30705_c0_g1_i1.p1 TRINITY_DN30705_c0_g1~~TRINITY_DN30705_c0_g1_i1.p1  ORF type:complete len:612 (-),score=78.75 TRINITY_DN30705_c0_g1_i1:328-2163(-)
MDSSNYGMHQASADEFVRLPLYPSGDDHDQGSSIGNSSLRSQSRGYEGYSSHETQGYELHSALPDPSRSSQPLVERYPEEERHAGADSCTTACRALGAFAFVLVVLGCASAMQYLSPRSGDQDEAPRAREVSLHRRHTDPMSLTLPPPPVVLLPTSTTTLPPTTLRTTTIKQKARNGSITVVYWNEHTDSSEKPSDAGQKPAAGIMCTWFQIGCPAAAADDDESYAHSTEFSSSTTTTSTTSEAEQSDAEQSDDSREDHGSLEILQPEKTSAFKAVQPEISLAETTTTTAAPVTEEEIEKAVNLETEAENTRYGDTSDAYNALKKSVEDAPTLKDCNYPRYQVLSKCVCPTGTTWDGKWCNKDAKPGQMTFYMYRAQGNDDYPMANVNMADLTGVMFYLHNEIVTYNTTPKTRVNGITRILRWLVTVTPSSQLVKRNVPFMPFVAFDKARCSVPGCNSLWEDYGFAVGCQEQNGAGYGYQPPAYWGVQSGAWFSLPGGCPEKAMGHKDGECLVRYPGGSCQGRPGSFGCTFSAHFAGEVFLDELERIKDYESWRAAGHREYDPATDTGVGTVFWNYRKSTTWCDRRMQRVRSLFKQKYPLLPNDLPRPECQ